MTSQDEEQRSIERVERAHRVFMDAFIRMQKQFYPNGSGVLSEEVMNAFDEAKLEYDAAKAEMNEIASQIRNGTRK